MDSKGSELSLCRNEGWALRCHPPGHNYLTGAWTPVPAFRCLELSTESMGSAMNQKLITTRNIISPRE
jgi:hypothetical protein